MSKDFNLLTDLNSNYQYTNVKYSLVNQKLKEIELNSLLDGLLEYDDYIVNKQAYLERIKKKIEEIKCFKTREWFREKIKKIFKDYNIKLNEEELENLFLNLTI